jgi:hypothetical protein
MSDVLYDLQDQLRPTLRDGDLAKCERTVVSRLAALPRSPFHIILDLSITSDPKQLAAGFDEFFRDVSERFKIGAAYTEMNGFDINPELWFCQPFAYERYGGHSENGWLSDWQGETEGGFVIEGFEALQEVYASDAVHDAKFRDACSIAGLLVVIRFQDLVRRSATHMQELHFPLLATAHDFDFVYEFRPGAEPCSAANAG